MTSRTVYKGPTVLAHTMEGEEWRPVVGFEERYEVSSMGRVRRSFSAPKCRSTYPGRLLNPDLSECGYYRARLCRNGKHQVEQVHRLIARAFLPGFEPNRQVNHKNGNKADNRLENLEWVTPRQNVLHAWRTGLCKPLRGEASGSSKLTKKEVEVILFLNAHKVAEKLLAEAFGVTIATVSSIVRGETWVHVTNNQKDN
jgi:hypothetical protein